MRLLPSKILVEVVGNEFPGPRHTVGVELVQTRDDRSWLVVWCSCRWSGDQFDIDGEVDLEALPAEVLEAAARSWRLHVRLSNRVYSIDKRLRRRAARALKEEE